MPGAHWNPETYLQFAAERSRPFYDLTSRIQATAPRQVVDLGCGPGQLTAGLADRWPAATILGIDDAPAMIDRAQQYAGERLRFQLGDLSAWTAVEPVDVLISNATLQWVPGHLDLLPRLVAALAPGGWLAIQVPGNFDQPSHQLLYGLAADPRFAPATAGLERPSAPDASTYLSHLAVLGLDVDAWETTYLHVLRGPDAVFRWMTGTGAGPFLQALSGEKRAEFETEYRALLHEAYPDHGFGSVLAFRRTFVVAHEPSSGPNGEAG